MVEIIGDDGFRGLSQKASEDSSHVVRGERELVPVDILPKLRHVSDAPQS